MNKLKQNTYTIMLMLTCFVASPFIFHKIWENSKDMKSPPPPSVSDGEKPNIPPSADSPVQESTENTPAEQNSQTPTENAAPAEIVFTGFVQSDPAYFDNALFIGDSRTVGIMDWGNLKNADYFCSVGLSANKIGSEVIDGQTFDQAIDAKKYGKVYIMLGINEIGNDLEYTVTAFRAVIEKIKVHQPEAIIYIQGNLHVTKSAESNVINNKAINVLNSRISEFADKKRVFYIDPNTKFDDENGNFNEQYSEDGIHPFAKYYQEWCNWLCTQTVPTDNYYTVPENEQPATEAPAETSPENKETTPA